ncbi:MAG: flavin reductase family protein [Oscillospiraceae bacterium]|nr:flavin reductase family protein [Oscillospiraceae bacterium]
MKDINIGQAQRLTAPCPFALLSAKRADGGTNLMAVSWWSYLSNHPPTLGVCLSKKGLSGGLIRESGEFGLSVVGEQLKDAALRCGTCSGRTVDKAAEFEIPLEDAAVIAPQVVSGSRVVFECRLTDTKEVADHVLYIAEIVAIRGGEEVRQLFAFDGYARLDSVN